MTNREAQMLSIRVQREDDRVQVVSDYMYVQQGRRRSYHVSCVDTRTGIPFTLTSSQDWEERKAAAELYA